MLLYDFIQKNEMYCADFECSQAVNYTFFSGENKSHINYILIPQYCQDMVTDCKILSDLPENTSHHLPVQCDLNIEVTNSNTNLKRVSTRSISFPSRLE